MRLLGVDLGTKRIGLAIGESSPQVVSPRPALTARGKLTLDAEQVAAKAKVEEVDAIVVGLPVELDGTEGRMATVMRQFGANLEALGYKVHMVDESFTSVEATDAMAGLDMTEAERRKRRDGEAACRILERVFRGQS